MHQHSHFETLLKTILCTRSYRNENHYKGKPFQNHFQKTHPTNTSLNYFQHNTLYAFLQKREPLQRHFFKITFKNTFHEHFFELFSKQHFVRVLIETRTITKTFLKYFQNHTTNHTFKQKQVIQQETKSPYITMDEKGANTFS